MPRSPYGQGIRKTPHGWQAYVKHHGRFYSKHFPPDTDLTKVRHWRKQEHARLVLGLTADPHDHRTLKEDTDAYLSAVSNMVSIKRRTHQITRWLDAFGWSRNRHTIKSVDIRQQLDVWRRELKLSPGSLNLHREALRHLFRVLDGKGQPNPVNDVPRLREEPPPLRLPSWADAEKVIASVRQPTRARLSLMLWTGWPPEQIRRLTPEDIRWQDRMALVRGRRKGKGTRDRWLPLLPQAVAALKDMETHRGWGRFHANTLGAAIHRACTRLDITRFRAYDLRHLFLTTVASITRDDRVVSELAMHTNPLMTRRYTEQSVDPRLRAGLEAVALATLASAGGVSEDHRGQSTPTQPGETPGLTRRKPRKD